jgi:endonuclease YncB( thermonuclease family)
MGESDFRIILRWLVACALAGVAVFSLSSPSAPGAPTAVTADIAGPASIVDGDTLDIGGQRVRLDGIDAPESAQTCSKRWAGSWDCGKAATRALGALINGHHVSCRSSGTDKYGRMLGVCSVEGTELNAALVRAGMAWAFVKYSTAYVAAEKQAKAAQAGVWQADTEAPWLFREKRWQVAEQAAPSGCAIKGNVTGNGQIYHMPWSPWYHKVKVEAARGERWFCSEAEAQKAGWRASQSH